MPPWLPVALRRPACGWNRRAVNAKTKLPPLRGRYTSAMQDEWFDEEEALVSASITDEQLAVLSGTTDLSTATFLQMTVDSVSPAAAAAILGNSTVSPHRIRGKKGSLQLRALRARPFTAGPSPCVSRRHMCRSGLWVSGCPSCSSSNFPAPRCRLSVNLAPRCGIFRFSGCAGLRAASQSRASAFRTGSLWPAHPRCCDLLSTLPLPKWAPSGGTASMHAP